MPLGPHLFCALVLNLGLSALIHAAPANDNFASRINLGNSTTVNTTGNNIAAAIESGEPTFSSSGGASVWYEWTALSSGWVSVNTVGSSIDTLIGVFTGTAVNALTQIGVNDDDFDTVERGDSYVSRLTFLAVAGTTYKIAVYGWSDGASVPEQGDFVLSLNQVATPAFSISSISLSPDPVNVTTAPATVTLTMGAAVTAGSGFSAQVTLTAVGDSAHQVTFPMTEAQRISGTLANGSYQTTFTVPRYVPGGNWNVKIESFDGTRSVTWSVGTDNEEDDFVIPASIDATLVVTNAGTVDSAKPVLLSFTAAPTSINSGAADDASRTITVDLRVTDNLSGFSSAIVTLEGSSVSYELGTIVASNRISGTVLDGIYEITTVLPFGFPADTYDVRVQVTDASLLTETYSSQPNSSTQLPSGSTAQLTVTGSLGYPSWAYGQFFLNGQFDMLADADQDGVSNLAEYAFNLDPSANDALLLTPSTGISGLPRISSIGSGASRALRVEYVRRKASYNSGLTYEVQFSDNLQSTGPGSWTTTAAFPIVTSIDDVWERVVIQDTISGALIRFARVKLTYVQP